MQNTSGQTTTFHVGNAERKSNTIRSGVFIAVFMFLGIGLVVIGFTILDGVLYATVVMGFFFIFMSTMLAFCLFSNRNEDSRRNRRLRINPSLSVPVYSISSHATQVGHAPPPYQEYSTSAPMNVPPQYQPPKHPTSPPAYESVIGNNYSNVGSTQYGFNTNQ